MYFNLGDFERLTLIILIAHRETAKTRLLMSEEQIAMTDTRDVYMTTADSTEDMDVHKGGPCMVMSMATPFGLHIEDFWIFVILVLQSLTSWDVSAPRASLRTFYWAWYHRTFYDKVMFSTTMFYNGVSGFGTHWPIGVWCLLYIGPRFGN